MKREIIFCCILAAILTGCEGRTVDNEAVKSVDTVTDASKTADAAANASKTEAPAMVVVENDQETEDNISPDLSENTDENEYPSDEAPAYNEAPEETEDTSVSGETAESEDTSETGDDSTEETGQSAGIFTSEKLSDEIKSRITGVSYPPGCGVSYDDLRYLRLSYVDFNGQTQLGEMICNKAVDDDLLSIFSELYHAGYQIDKIKLIEEYGADDDLSCADDNTSCFNYRVVAGSTNLSKHALGVAVDINPFYNPYVTYPNGSIRISPPGSEPYADRKADFPHKIDENDLAYKLFTKHGFTWGGHWKTLKDYQHFQKPL